MKGGDGVRNFESASSQLNFRPRLWSTSTEQSNLHSSFTDNSVVDVIEE